MLGDDLMDAMISAAQRGVDVRIIMPGIPDITKPPARTHIPAVSAVLEFAFWPFAAFFVSEFMYYAAYGDLSFHNFLALGLGVLLWRKAFYDIVY